MVGMARAGNRAGDAFRDLALESFEEQVRIRLVLDGVTPNSTSPQGASMDKPTQEQLKELKRLSKEARVEDWSEIVQSKDEAEMRIRDLKEKARIE